MQQYVADAGHFGYGGHKAMDLKPYYYDGKPVEIEANITVNFNLVE